MARPKILADHLPIELAMHRRVESRRRQEPDACIGKKKWKEILHKDMHTGDVFAKPAVEGSICMTEVDLKSREASCSRAERVVVRRA